MKGIQVSAKVPNTYLVAKQNDIPWRLRQTIHITNLREDESSGLLASTSILNLCFFCHLLVIYDSLQKGLSVAFAANHMRQENKKAIPFIRKKMHLEWLYGIR